LHHLRRKTSVRLSSRAISVPVDSHVATFDDARQILSLYSAVISREPNRPVGKAKTDANVVDKCYSRMPQTYSCVPRPCILREDAAVNLSAAFMITTLASAINEIASEMPLLRTLLGVMGRTKVCRYKWHSAGSPGWPFPVL